MVILFNVACIITRNIKNTTTVSTVYIILHACLMIPLEEVPGRVITGTKAFEKTSSLLILWTVCPLERRCRWAPPTCRVSHGGCANTETLNRLSQSDGWKRQLCHLHVRPCDRSPNSTISPIPLTIPISPSENSAYIIFAYFSTFFLIGKSSFVLYWRHNPWTVLYVGNGLSLF